MPWYDNTVKSLEAGKTYTRNALMAQLRKDNPSLSRNSFQWAIGGMLKSGKIVRGGFDKYTLSGDNERPRYVPTYSETAGTLIEKVSQKFPYIQFTVFESLLMNEFLNHLIAQNTIFIQVEKEASVFVFRHLQEEGYQNLMYKPSTKQFSLYWAKDSVIVTDIISEAPKEQGSPHAICLEKMLVDMYCDKLISKLYGKAEFNSIVGQALSRYLVEKTKLLRYARRRNKGTEMTEILEANV